MKLITKELEKRLCEFPFGSQECLGEDAIVVVKYFNPYGAGTWLITEAEKQKNGDWLFFGYCHIFEWEWGYVMLSDLQRSGLPFGLTLERDLYIGDKAKVKDLI